jgi:hypothetical protein
MYLPEGLRIEEGTLARSEKGGGGCLEGRRERGRRERGKEGWRIIAKNRTTS